MSQKKTEFLEPVLSNDLIVTLNAAIGERMLILAGSCTAFFDGRIKSTLELGERILIIKKDLSILMHGVSGVKPLNWQKPNQGPISFLKEKNELVMYTKRKKTEEELWIRFRSIDFVILWSGSDFSSLEIYGDESDLVQYLVKHPSIIEKDLQILSTEYPTDVGFVDIKALDSKKRLIIIEVKKRNATPSDAFQLKRYKDYFENIENKKIRAILVAPSFPDKVKKYLEINNLEFQEVDWKNIFPTISREKNMKIDDFFF
ncbi:MAG: endonuclease NucS [Candidatus Heimdallarchaeum aukensis]|uniref:Endonuclease NucS n=1 Tax=Candidatus Heimdallarchaeum aukensis TaxID=2876573 RepID=A0A9Y1BMX7_9ARCH|nr:MAG: endonuclease NucS [Candidatus Heimdallarchaeum aukensis]